MVGILSMMLMIVVHRKANCQDPLVNNISDLRSLLVTLQTWEAQHADHPAQAGLRRVATELETVLVAKSTSPPPPMALPASSSSGSAAVERGSLRSLAVGGTQCFVAPKAEFWGEPVVWGPEHHTPDAAECCAACRAHQLAAARGGLDAGVNSTACNTWVYCGNQERCGPHYRECWLKHQQTIPPPEARASSGNNANSIWTSGVVYDSDEWLKQYDSRATLTLHFELGDVVVRLLPELAPASVRELRRMAALLALEGTGCDGCKLYRSEVNFLVQGVIRHPGAYVATPRRPNPPQKKVMERGLACWAGGMGGPDWFVNLIDQSGFGDDHLCWGKIEDMSLMDAIVKLPTKPKAKPNEMTFLAQELRFNMTLS
ncbi:hypothetical protein HYH02_014100 [Chlamydomonas schloesseri]|uniref:PPIase cyclophilin-type domain-containing protein n=1 Tax=Chlamydomonas schloesseri TaxID=2026947 RepID=A0A835SYL4_9CHLO|nr:hypothetical protein HYH02_014100 [Chlamydomonas schloesseri]|eukprot:KAG2429165.1 hypothetical protein HYH02_014100 [Chlamydomonas schloesseri]